MILNKHEVATMLDAWTAAFATIFVSFKLFLSNTVGVSPFNTFMDGTLGIITWLIALFTMVWAFFRMVESIIDNYRSFKKWLVRKKQNR